MAGRPLSQIDIEQSGPLKGDITPPPDKSISHRAVIISSLAEGRSSIKNFLHAEDSMRTLEAFKQMGVDIKETEGSRDQGVKGSKNLVVNGKGLNGLKEPENIIDCGNSGTTMRLLSGVLAGQPFTAKLTGDSSLRKRPMQRVIDPLYKMGAEINSEQGGYPPLNIKGGNLSPVNYNLSIASAQVKSAILFAGLFCNGTTSVTSPGKSRDHTENMLRAAGAEVTETGQKVSIKGIDKLKPIDITIPGDFSSAAFFIVAGLLIPGSEILIRNVGLNTTRISLLSILKDMIKSDSKKVIAETIQLLKMRTVSYEPVADILVKHAELKSVKVGSSRLISAIDEFPILCVAAANAEGVTEITGAGELRVKESDRIASMASELKKMGVKVKELDDGIIITGSKTLKAAKVQSNGDHRIAMAMTVAGLVSDGKTEVDNSDCIDTSFPGFKTMLDKLIKP